MIQADTTEPTMSSSFSGGFSSLIEKMDQWLTDLILILPNLLLSILVGGIAYFASRFVQKYLLKGIRQFTNNRTIARTFANIGTAIFLTIMLFVILGILNLDKALNTFLASAGVAGLAIGLALQEPLMNVFSGVMLSIREKYNIGDLIETNGFMGTIKDVNLKATILELLTGESVSIPNKLVLQNPIKNYTSNGIRRVDLACGVSYDANLKEVRTVAIEAIEGSSELVKEKGVQLFFNEFGGSSINFTLRFWINKIPQSKYLEARSEAIIAIKAAFDKHDINIPYPIRTIDLGLGNEDPLTDLSESLNIKNN